MQNEPSASSYTPPLPAPDAPTTTSAGEHAPYAAPSAVPPGYPPPPPASYPPYTSPPPGYPPYGPGYGYNYGYNYGPPVYPPPYYPGPMPPSTSYFAIASLACALGGILIFFPFGAGLGAILGIIFGHVALGDIRRSHGAKVGRGMAIAGLVTGYLLIALLVMLFLLALSTQRIFIRP